MVKNKTKRIKEGEVRHIHVWGWEKKAKIFWTFDGTMYPEVDSASGNEYQGFLLGQKRPVRLADHLPPS